MNHILEKNLIIYLKKKTVHDRKKVEIISIPTSSLLLYKIKTTRAHTNTNTNNYSIHTELTLLLLPPFLCSFMGLNCNHHFKHRLNSATFSHLGWTLCLNEALLPLFTLLLNWSVSLSCLFLFWLFWATGVLWKPEKSLLYGVWSLNWRYETMLGIQQGHAFLSVGGILIVFSFFFLWMKCLRL